MKNVKEDEAKVHFIETLQCRLNNQLLDQRNPASSALYNKASVLIKATSHRRCRLMKTQQHLPSQLRGVPCFSNNDIVIEAHVIGAGKFEEVHFRKFPRLSLCIAAKCPRKRRAATEKSVFNEAVAMLTLSDSKSFRFCYGIYNRNVIIMMEQKLPNLIQTYQQPK